MTIWEMVTTFSKDKRAPVVFLSLTGKAQEAILELDPLTLNTDTGMDALYAKLDSIFKVDSAQAALTAYADFEKYSRPSSMSITDFNVEFDSMVQKLREHDIKLPDAVLAHRALKSANLREENEKLVVATVKEASSQEMIQIKKIMGVRSEVSQKSSPGPVACVKTEPQEVNFSDDHSSYCDSTISEGDVMYNSYGRDFQKRKNRGRGAFRGGNRYQRSRGRGRGNRGYGQGTQNPRGSDGKPSQCHVCQSTMHWARNCPHKDDEDADEKKPYETSIVLLNNQTAGDNSLLGETLGSVVLDSGCSRTVCGGTWYECYLDTLPQHIRDKVKPVSSDARFRFGNGEVLKSKFNVKLPCRLAGKTVEIATDVVDSDIPLLLSKSSMKKSNTVLNFVNDSVSIFGKNLKLKCTSSGHYYIPLSRLSGVDNINFVLIATQDISASSMDGKRKIAIKLHRQFSHPSSDKLIGLVKDAGIKDKEFISVLQEVSLKCDLCNRYKKAPPRPVVGFSLAKRFNETVSLDLKEIDGTRILHLIDNFTRFSVAGRVKSKDSSEIISVIFKLWIAYFGPPSYFLSDNGREFDNEHFRDMAQNLNIIVLPTAAQSPWSNGICERHNAIIGSTVKKIIEDVGCSFDLALAWAVSSKNALHNIGGFSPNQLVFGFNPNIPNVANNKPPALECVSSSDVVARNLNALHSARRAFIESESSEKLQRALRHQIRPDFAQSYSNGDLVYYKRNESPRWLGPGSVIGTENKQILVKHGGSYVRVHQSRLKKYSSNVDVPHDKSAESLNRSNAEESVEAGCSSKIPFYEPEEEDQREEENEEQNRGEGEDQNREEFENVSNEVNDYVPSSEPSSFPGRRSRGRPRKSKPRNNEVNLPKAGQKILCKLTGQNSEWQEITVLSRAGKATGANRYIMNVKMIDGDTWLDFEKSVSEWKECENITASDESCSDSADEEVLAMSDNYGNFDEAKQIELKSWVGNQVFTVVPDRGQDCISTRWIYSIKKCKTGSVKKARLVAKGFQDQESDVRSDSPTCAKESLRLALTTIASSGWKVNSMDVKTAFLQGKNFRREVYLIPPKEAHESKGKLWKLNKCVYGLNDASREWYLTVREELIRAGAKPSVFDQAIFTWHNAGKLAGIICCHVDDFCWGGTPDFEKHIVDRIRHVFSVKTEESLQFPYLGLEVHQKDGKIDISQNEYMQSLQLIPKKLDYGPDTPLSNVELKMCRSSIGKLNWLATQTRPDISFEVSELTSSLKEKGVDSIANINKTIRKVKKQASKLVVPNLGDITKARIQAYCDASFGSHMNGSSHGGYIIYLVGNNENYVPVAWQSRKIKRVVKSTHAAETLATVDALEASIYYRRLLLEMLRLEDIPNNIPISCKTDSKALYSSAHTSTQILDKRLRIENAIIREMLEEKSVRDLSWIPTTSQIADGLTKRGVSSSKILDHIGDARVPLP